MLAACAKRNSSSVFTANKGNFSLLETALEQLSSTTRRGAAGSEARGAALARVSEKALLLEDPTAGLASGGHEKNREALENRGKRKKKKKARKSACGHSRPKASQLALAAAAAPRPKRAALARLGAARALASTPADAVAALEAQWKAYVRKLAASSSGGGAAPSSASAPSTLGALTLVGARARVAASSRESALVGRSGVVVAESRRAWHLFEREGKVSAVSKAGAELEVEFAREGGGGGGGGGGEGEGEGGEGEALRVVAAIRVGGGALL